ncbi:hypothetical protein LSAT2_031538, partial [Lamellibrachia satsuma]
AKIQKFIHYLDLNRDNIFADAVYAINKSRQERLRMPEQRSDEKQVRDLKAHTDRRIKELSDQYRVINRESYIELRDAICSRLTLFNARRGGEPSRLKMKNWSDAVGGSMLFSIAVSRDDVRTETTSTERTPLAASQDEARSERTFKKKGGYAVHMQPNSKKKGM